MPLIQPPLSPLTRGLDRSPSVVSAGAAAFDYGALFAGLSAGGWCVHGGAGRSSFYEDSAGTTPATDSGVSPVGKITDLSGNGAHPLQSTSGAKPLYNEADGIRWYTGGVVSAANRFLDPAVACYVSAAMTQIVVFKRTDGVTGNYAALISNLVGGSWGVGGYHRLAGQDGSNLVEFLCDTTTTPISADPTGGHPVIVVARRAGTGANQSTLSLYDLAGTLHGTTTGTQNAVPSNRLLLGYDGVAGSQAQVAFSLMINAALSTDNVDAIVADLVDSLGAWAP